MKLSEILIDYRNKMNISQREFSRACNLSNSYISFLEREMNPRTGKPMAPTLEQYKKLANGMNISVQRLFELLDEDAPVNLRPLGSDLETEDFPANKEVCMIVRLLNRMSPDQLDQVSRVLVAMFSKSNPELFLNI